MTSPSSSGARVLTREEARDALSRVLRVCRESGYRKLGISKRIYENRELVRCLYEQHMALGQAFTTFIGCGNNILISKGKRGNTDLGKKVKIMRKTIKTYLSGFEIKRCTTLSFLIFVFATGVFLDANRELMYCEMEYFKEGILHFKIALKYITLGLLLFKTLLLRELDTLFDIGTVFLLWLIYFVS